MYILEDKTTGLLFSRESYRHHGYWHCRNAWSTCSAHSPQFPTINAALDYAKQNGFDLTRTQAIELVAGVGGFDGERS